MKSPDILTVYDEYNKKFFRGKLPSLFVTFGKLAGRNGSANFLSDGTPVSITLAPMLRTRGRLCRIVLLHEMAHISVGVKALHGPKHDKELDRLYKAGAYKGLL